MEEVPGSIPGQALTMDLYPVHSFAFFPSPYDAVYRL